ncbi:MAG TPA: hypothetical protein VE172_21835 [Stackebrandtia sp.]|jgi:hypothetical protein|uniref:hypothetical protein n=1 Tax=Stackebrandtia sp. TaxID=2023065 RepID=UPI002D73D144|nr:hypothetical protein [Stackebrandtia sp.]HZE41451.1 hypothetical protein [Stackebrandtia sp.]
MGSYYSPSELDDKAHEIIKEAKAATIRDAESYRDAVNAKYQTDYNNAGNTGTAPPAMMPIGPDEEKEFEGWLDTYFDWIPPAYADYTKPQPEGFDSIISACKSVETTFGQSDGAIGNSDTSYINKAESEMGEWLGSLSENLQNNFLVPFPVIASNHGKIAQMLRMAMEGTQNIYAGQKRDISECADQTIDALKDVGGRDGGSESMGLTILGALTSIAGAALAIPSGGTSLAVTGVVLATIGAGTSIGGQLVPADQTLPLGGDTADDVISNMLDRMSDICTKVYDKEQDVCDVLSKNYDLLSTLRQLANAKGESGPVVPLRPTIADSKDPTSGLTPRD